MAPIRSDTLQSLRSLSASRGELLRGRTHLLPENPLSFFRAIITASVLAAFLWWVCARMKTGLILLSNIQSTAKGDWLVHSFGTDWHLHKSLISAIFTTLTPVLSGIVMVTALLLPFRDVFFEGIRVRRVELAKALGVSLLAAILSGVIVSFLDPIFIRPLFRTIYLIPSTIPYRLSIIVACVLFLVFVIVKWAPLLNNIRCLARRFIPMLFMMFLPLIISILFFDQISILARIILFIPAAMAVCIPHSLIANPKPDTDTYMLSEWLEYERILFYKRTRLKTPSELNLFDISDVFAGIARGVITFTVPILLIMLIAYPLLLKFDNWFVSNLPLLQAKVAELNKIPIDVARGMKWHIVQKYFGAYILVDLHKTFGWKASSIILGISLVLLTIPFFGALIFRLYQDAEERFAMLERYPILFRLYNLFQLPAIGSTQSSYISTVTPMISKATPFINGPEKVPRMRATCDALVLLGNHIPADKSGDISAWLRTCASSSGGFGYAPGMQPTPLHTYHAIKALTKLGLLSAEDKNLHRRWIENQIAGFLEFNALPSDCLRKISLLVRSLVMLSDGKIDIRLVQQIGKTIPQLWQKCSQSVEDMANALHALQALGLLEVSPIANEIRSGSFLAYHEARIISSDPKNNLPKIESLIEIETMLFPADYQARPCVLQIQDIISKTKFSVTVLE